jgi:O-methyltransferase domain
MSNTTKVPPTAAIRAVTVLRSWLSRASDRLLPAPLAVAELGHQFARAHVLSALSELQVADALGSHAMTSPDLAARLGCDPDALHRLLRAAATFGAVRMGKDGRVSATRLTRTLRADDVHAAGAWCGYLSSTAHQQAWGDLVTSVRTGRSAFHRVHRQSLFEWLAGHPDEGERFTRGLAGLTLADAPFVIAALNLPDRGVVCDVAGGRGVLLAEILQARPGLRGVLVESEPVLLEAKAYLAVRGLLERVDLVPGDIFAPYQVTADLYLLKWILHDWDDAACRRLLSGLAATMPDGARAVVIEGLQEPNVVDPRFSMIDLEMLVVTEDGRERSADELRGLMTDAGLTPTTLTVTATGTAVLTGRRLGAAARHCDE